LDEEMRGGLISAGPGKDQFVLEIETYEATLVQEQAGKPQPAGNDKSRAEQAPSPSSDLDPLFDDED
jgi:hypothetical protein